jgi:hypothetical protein
MGCASLQVLGQYCPPHVVQPTRTSCGSFLKMDSCKTRLATVSLPRILLPQTAPASLPPSAPLQIPSNSLVEEPSRWNWQDLYTLTLTLQATLCAHPSWSRLPSCSGSSQCKEHHHPTPSSTFHSEECALLTPRPPNSRNTKYQVEGVRERDILYLVVPRAL